jgi:hypothetical protein
MFLMRLVNMAHALGLLGFTRPCVAGVLHRTRRRTQRMGEAAAADV